MIAPSSVPAGLTLELARARLLPGTDPIVDEWMQMLNDRVDECVATLHRERMAFEAIFRHTDEHGDGWLYWVSVQGADNEGMDESNPLDADHVAFAKRVKGPGWEVLTPQLMLAPDHIRSSMLAWALEGAVR